MSLESGRQRHGSSVESAHHCRHCGGALDGLGFHFTCHLCGANYCFVHMRKHDSAHPRTAVELLAA